MRLPHNFSEIDLGMTNFDHSIDDGFEEALRGGNVFGRHAGWNFNAKVWFEEDQFHSEIWVYHSYQETISSDTLEDLMRQTNYEYGSR